MPVHYCSILKKPEVPVSSCLGPSTSPSSTRAMEVSLTSAVNRPIKLTIPTLGVASYGPTGADAGAGPNGQHAVLPATPLEPLRCES